MNALPLLAGSYFINVGLYPTDWTYLYDFHWEMYSLHMEAILSGSYSTGMVAVDTRWGLKTQD